MAGAIAALSDGDFARAVEALGDGDGEHTPVWWELRAQASYGNGAYEDAVESWERLHALHRAAGERVPAARAAAMTAMLLLIDAGLLSTVRGWVRRAQGLLIGHPDTPVHALVAAVLTYERLFSGDVDAAARQSADAISLGERFDVMPAVAIGRTAAGRIAILRGDVEDGLSQLDEVAALLMSGEVDGLTTGMMFCELICAAQSLARPDLAREWTDAMVRWSVTGAFGAVRGRCRVHQAELLRLSGPCDAAERMALVACEELRPWMRREYGWPLVELGLVRLRRGDLAGAEETFLGACEHGWPPHPGLALLRLEQGDVAAAALEIASAIAHPIDAPSKEFPPFGDLRTAPLRDAQSEIAAAADDIAVLTEAAAELARVAERYGGPSLAATADLARARHALSAGDTTAAITSAASAIAAFVALDAPFDAARARTVLAEAHAATGNVVGSRRELIAARADYARYGAQRRAAAIDRRLEHVAQTHPAPTPASTTHHQGTLRCEGPMWTVGLGGHQTRVKDLKGLRYLHRLVAEPGREFHVLDIVAVESGTLRATGANEAGLPALDDAARDAYRRRLLDIDDDIDDATRLNDLGRLEKGEADRHYLINELTRAVGLGGRSRTTGDSSERARTAVARTLRYALDELGREHPPLADHLRASVRTGTYCSYQPDRLATITWSL